MPPTRSRLPPLRIMQSLSICVIACGWMSIKSELACDGVSGLQMQPLSVTVSGSEGRQLQRRLDVRVVTYLQRFPYSYGRSKPARSSW